MYHYLKISCTGEGGDWIGCVGGAGFDPQEAIRQFYEIPKAADDKEGPGPAVLLDYLNEEGEIQDTKEIEFETAARLLSMQVEDIYPTAKADAEKQHAEFRRFLEKS